MSIMNIAIALFNVYILGKNVLHINYIGMRVTFSLDTVADRFTFLKSILRNSRAHEIVYLTTPGDPIVVRGSMYYSLRYLRPIIDDILESTCGHCIISIADGAGRSAMLVGDDTSNMYNSACKELGIKTSQLYKCSMVITFRDLLDDHT